MPSEVKWLVDEHVILITYSDTIDLESSQNANNQSIGLALQYPDHTIHSVFDFSNVRNISISVAGITQSAAGLEKAKNLGHAVVINSPAAGLSIMINMFINIFGRVFRLKVRKVDSLEEAISFLYGVDPSIPQLDS